MARLPIPGGDENTWGSVLNSFLSVSHNSDGTIATDAVGTANIANSNVTYAKIQNVTDNRLLGRSAGSAGTVHEITIGSGLTLAGGTLSGSGGSYDDEQAQDAVGGILSDAGDIDFTYDDTTPAITAVVKTDSVTYAKIQNVSATDRILGRDTAGAGDIEELTVGGGLEFTGTGLQRSALSGDVTASAGSNTTTIANDAVTYAKMQNISATDRLLGRDTTGAGDTEELTVGGGIEFTGSGGIQTSAFTGDVTKTAGGTSTTIANDAVTYAKMQNVSATDKVLGRSTAGAGDVEEITMTAAGRALVDDADAAAQRTTLALVDANKGCIGISIDGGGSAITTGVKGYVSVPYGGTITSWRILCDVSGSIVIDVWKDTYANALPTVADTITASAKPTVTTATKNESSTLTGWTTSVTLGDVFGFNVDSATTVTKATLQIFITKA